MPSTRKTQLAKSTSLPRRHTRPAECDETEAASREPFEAISGLDDLRYDLGRLEALAAAASERLDCLPHTTSTEERQAMSRLHHLVTLVAEEAARILDAAKNIVSGVPKAQ